MLLDLIYIRGASITNAALISGIKYENAKLIKRTYETDGRYKRIYSSDGQLNPD